MEHIKELIRMATHFNVTPDYDNVLQYIYDSERQFLLNILNNEELPSELNQLLDKRVAARLQPISKLKEGDTEIDFDSAHNAATTLSTLTYKWLSLEGTDITCYRKLRW